MRSSTTSAFAPLALLLAALAGTACSGSPSDTADDSAAAPARPGEDPKAPAVTGTPNQNELTEAFGVFVAPSGRADGAGTRELPLSSVQAGIALGKRAGKRVYVCNGTYAEALVLADSISIIGGLECTDPYWRFGGARSRIEAPSSPAVRAQNITSSTRLEALDIHSPKAHVPSGSSIGLLADHSPGLVIAGTTIVAGDAADGIDGQEGTQLTQSSSADGGGTVMEGECIDNVTCTKQAVAALYPWLKPRGALGGTSTCAGAPGHNGGPGGFGGSGGLFMPVQSGPTYVWHYYADAPGMAPEYGQHQDGTAGAAGASGTPSANGSLSSEGFAAANGVAGTNGAPGAGGFGGRGSNPRTDPGAVRFDAVWRGAGGPGGGAGGCPGLAGTAGTGGGASIALALVDSPLIVDGAQLVAGRAGAGGHGTFGSDPTVGGRAGQNLTAGIENAARPGGNGGAAGMSTNGSNGPSVAVLHTGPAPIVKGGSKLTPGESAEAIAPRTHRDALGNVKTIPSTPAGVSKNMLAF